MPTDRDGRRRWLFERGTPYAGVVAAKRAYRAGQIDRATYEDIAWALERRLDDTVRALKLAYRERRIDRSTYESELRAAKRSYKGG